MLRFALCDDEESAHAALRETISTIPGYRRAADVRISEYRRGEDLLADVTEGYERFDLVFLDIYMDGITGVETARRLRAAKDRTPIVFLTTSPNFGVEAFEVEAAGYLLKPAGREKLSALLGKVLAPAYQPRVMLLCSRERRYFNLGDILYAESFSHVVQLHLVSGEVVACSENLMELEKALADPRFLRCHQSYLVNLEHVKDVREDFLMDTGVHIPIPVRRRREMADIYYRFFVSAAVGRGAGEEDVYV